MKIYGIGDFAKMIGVTRQTLRIWDKLGKLKPYHVSDSRYRYYSQTQFNELMRKKEPVQRFVVGYARVSSPKQKDDLERQVESVRTYMIAKGYSFEIISDIGSGINYNKKGLNRLLELIVSSRVEKIVILYKDRLLRFGYELMENLCDQFGTSIEIIDCAEKTEEQELVEDLIQIVTVFSCQLQGKRANKAKKILKELMKNDSCEKS